MPVLKRNGSRMKHGLRSVGLDYVGLERNSKTVATLTEVLGPGSLKRLTPVGSQKDQEIL